MSPFAAPPAYSAAAFSAGGMGGGAGGYGAPAPDALVDSVSDFAARVATFYPALPGGAFFGLTIAVLVLCFAAWALVLQLFFFHLHLSAF